MTLDDFRATLEAPAPPPGLGAPLAALWWTGRPDGRSPSGAGWARAHALVQDEPGPDAAWVHAHLHRIEDDPGNAAYWYRRAGRPAAGADLAAEWAEIAAALLAR
ncbi:hypothetical protein [Methylobacterium sp. A54F]